MQISNVIALVVKAIPEVIPLLKPQTLQRAFKSEGHWVTINGNPVLIEGPDPTELDKLQIDEATKAEIEKLRKQTATTGMEAGALIAKDGTVLEHYDGTRTTTKVNTMLLPPGSTFIHTHPDSSSFSPDDLYIFSTSPASTFIVVTQGRDYWIGKDSAGLPKWTLPTFRKKYLRYLQNTPEGASASTHAARGLAQEAGFSFGVAK